MVVLIFLASLKLEASSTSVACFAQITRTI